MPLTNAEKQKRYRERLKNNPEKQEEIRKKNLGRIKTKTKKVKDMTEEEKNETRKKWRKQKQKQKQNQKEKKKSEKNTEKIDRQKNMPRFKLRLKKLNIHYKKSLSTIQKLHTTISTLRKRNYRQKKLLKAVTEQKNEEIDKLKCRNEVLESTIKAIYKSLKSLQKRHVTNVALNEAQRHNINSKVFVSKCLGVARVRKYKKKQSKSGQRSKEITKFFVRDDISRITAGKKECRTKEKNKEQIRYMTDTLSNLYKIYRSEGGQLSFSTFYKYKPFYVLSPTAQSRETCLCIKHSNMNYLLKAIISKKLINRGTTLKDILSQITCDITSFDCMHNKCSHCVNKTTEFDVGNKKDEQATWWKWESAKHTYTKKDKNGGEGKEMQTRKTTKQTKTGTLTELTETFNKEIKLFKKHYFNMKTQQNQYQACLRQLQPHEILMVCDYSENYNSKLSEEIQAMHFGASKEQISLHCVMVYWKDKCQSFCTVSESPCHEPSAIWAHLLPVMKFIKEKSPNTRVMHIYSDGPTSQYRQKKNYFLLNMFTQKINIDYATWSFTESGHGKGVADGIGGAVKRCLDRQVLYGHDLRNADDVFANICAAMKSVKSFLIPLEEIENMQKIIPQNLRPLSGNNEVHQIITTNEENAVLYRPLSCFCGNKPGMCSCFLPKKHCLLHVPVHQRVPDMPEKLEDRDIFEVFTGENISLHAPSHHSENEDVKMSSVDDIASNKLPIVVITEPTSPDVIVQVTDQDISTKKSNEPMLLHATSHHSENEDVKMSSVDDIASNKLPIVVITEPTSPDMTVQVINQAISNEPKLLDATSHHSENEDVKMMSVDDIASNELPIVVITEPTSPEHNRSGSEVKKNNKAQVYHPKKSSANCSEKASIMTHRSIKRKNIDKGMVLPKKVKVLQPTSMPSSSENKVYKSLKTVVTRYYNCHLCKLRKFFIKSETATCMACKSYVCIECSEQQISFDYICDKCFE